MSIINKMLQDLDRRQGMSSPDATLVQQVRTVPAARNDREWFWRIVAALLVVAVGWVGWIAWQLRPHASVATEAAFKAALNAPRTPAPAAAPAPTTVLAPSPAPAPAAAAIPAPVPEPAPQAVEAPKPAAVAAERGRRPTTKSPEKMTPATAGRTPAAASAPTSPGGPRKLDLDVPPARILDAPVPATTRVVKRDRVRTAEDVAEADFRRGAILLNQGRVGEAEEAFSAALATQPGHEGARQALISLHLENRRVDEARRLLQEGLAVNPGNAAFAGVLARIFIERRDYAAALSVLDAARTSNAMDAGLNALRGTVLQRMGRHAEAVDAFELSLRTAPQNGQVLVSQGISLETMGRRAEAASAFRRALAAAPLGTELKTFAEQRLRALQ